MTESERFFSETRPLRLFVTAAVPGALGMLVSSIYGLVDGAFVGRFVGETAFAAINLAMPFVIIIFAFGDLIGVGSSVLISIARGKGERERANNIFTCACIMNVGFGLVTGLVNVVAAQKIMELMGATGELARQGATYLRVYSYFLPATTITYAVDNYLRICGRIRRSMVANMAMAVIGALIEYVLLGILGFGVGASALSYSLGMCVCAAIAFAPFLRGGMDLSFTRPEFGPGIVRDIMGNGVAPFLENVSGRITSIVFNASLLTLGGEDAVSTYGVLMFGDMVLIPLIYGTVDALQPAVGFNWGARRLGRVKALEYYCFGACAAISLSFMVLILVGAPQLVCFFVPEADAAFLSMAVPALRAFSLSCAVRWLPYATQAFMVAVGQSRLASLLTISQSLVIPLIVLTVLWSCGLEGVWINIPVSSAIACLLAVGILVFFRSTLRQRLPRT